MGLPVFSISEWKTGVGAERVRGNVPLAQMRIQTRMSPLRRLKVACNDVPT
jgi:hypothetical protein